MVIKVYGFPDCMFRAVSNGLMEGDTCIRQDRTLDGKKQFQSINTFAKRFD